MTALAIGKFDALHRGHFALIESAASLGKPGILTFSDMAAVLGWETRLPLVAPADRARILALWSEQIGQPITSIELPFTTIRDLSPDEFIHKLVHEFGSTAVVVGEDFRFGRDRRGDVMMLAQGIATHGGVASVVTPICHDDDVISSSRVRTALTTGDVELATALLNRPHRLLGTVVRGDGRGRQLGIPTVNLGERQNQEPAPGVYAGWAQLGQQRIAAAINIGRLPTVAEQRPLTVEAHLLDWEGDCYGHPLSFDFVSRLRAEQRFASLDALVEQIRADIGSVRKKLLETT